MVLVSHDFRLIRQVRDAAKRERCGQRLNRDARVLGGRQNLGL